MTDSERSRTPEIERNPYIDPGGDACEAENRELRAEVERLREAFDRESLINHELTGALTRKTAEVDRLREEREMYAGVWRDTRTDRDGLLDEVERLREALREVANGDDIWPTDLQRIAQEALDAR